MKTTKLIMAAILAFGLAACEYENEPEVNVNCCCNGSSVTQKKLTGVFSVAKNHRVRFAPGNLQYEAGKWRFADEQFLYLGYLNDEANKDHEYAWEGPHDLFAYGQTGYGNAAMKNLTSTENKYYGGYNDDNTSVCDSIDGTNWDWGIYCAIENGGNQPGLWRTLAKREWVYLLEGRANAEKLYAPAMVAGRRGVIILADNYSHPDGVAYPNSNKSFIDGVNIYCYSDWKKLEAGGAIFLPCAGCYSPGTGYATYYPEMCGYYWTTTNYSTTSQDAYAVQFGYTYTGTTYNAIRTTQAPQKRLRCAVRLVQEVR